MNRPATVDGDAPLRLFCALTLPADVRHALGAWQRSFPPHDGRAVAVDSLHVTLAFLGQRPAADVDSVARALRQAVASIDGTPLLAPLRYRETRTVSMLVLSDEEERAARMAVVLQEALEGLGLYRREQRQWLPHVTVLRFRRPPRLRPSLPELSAFSPSEATVYHSLLRRGGAQYQVLESVPLGG